MALALTLGACASPVPVAENFPLTYQRVARSVHHWDVVAADVVQQTATMLQSHAALKGRPIVISTTGRSTPFNVAFSDFLTNHMVQAGLRVNQCRGAAAPGGFALDGSEIEVRHDVQLVQHGEWPPQYRPGAYTALAAGIGVARAIEHSSFSGGEAVALGIVGGALADLAAGHVAFATRSELVVTTTIAEQNRYLFRRSDVYYVPDGDAHLFVAHYGRTSPCPHMARADAGRSEDSARWEMYVTAMRRSNPKWRGPSWYPDE